jgi:hypothetical protein
MADLGDLSKALKGLSKPLKKEVEVLLKESAETIIDYAATHHRYSDGGSGNLSKGGVYTLNFPSVLIEWSGKLSGASKYVLAIHEGHSGRNTKKNKGNQTWKPDPFFYEAVKKTNGKIRRKIKKNINAIFKKELTNL